MAQYIFGVVLFGLISVGSILACGWIMSDQGWEKTCSLFRRIGSCFNPRPLRFEDRDGNEVVIWGPPWKL